MLHEGRKQAVIDANSERGLATGFILPERFSCDQQRSRSMRHQYIVAGEGSGACPALTPGWLKNLRQLNRFGENALGMIQRLADWTIDMIATADRLTAYRANGRFRRLAQSPKLFCVIAKARLTPRDQQLVFGGCIEDLYGDHRVIFNQIPAAQANCHNNLQFLSLQYNKEGYRKSSGFNICARFEPP